MSFILFFSVVLYLVYFLKLCLGINGIFYYAVTFFTEAGIEETKAKAGL